MAIDRILPLDDDVTVTRSGPGSPQQLILERYQVVRCLGRGGMGVVYEAEHRMLGSRHAIKVLLDQVGGDPDGKQAERFLREARLCVSLRHPNLVLVTDCGLDNGQPVIVMDMIDGNDLAWYIRDGHPLTPAAAIRIGAQAASALSLLHQRGIVHRDIKPSNLMLERGTGRVVLMDLGISRNLQESSDMTLGRILGTPTYMAPEQSRDSSSVGPAADIYSLGAAIAALLVARAPADKGSAYALIDTIREQVYASGSIIGLYPELATLVPTGLRTVIEDATRFDPTQRPSATQIRERLAALDVEGVICIPRLSVDAQAAGPLPVASANSFATPSHITPKKAFPGTTFMTPVTPVDGVAAQRIPVTVEPSVGPAAGTPSVSVPGSRMWLVPVVLLPVIGVFAWRLLAWGTPPMPVAVGVAVPVAPVAAVPAVPVAESWTPPSESLPQFRSLSLPDGEPIVVCLLPAGSTRLGSDDPARPYDRPQVKVTFTGPRWMGRYETTCGQYARFLGTCGPVHDPGFDQFTQGPMGYVAAAGFERLPVRGVNLADARAFCIWLAKVLMVPVRLPGEVEWEYAARGGNASPWPWGDAWRPDRCRADGHDQPVAVGSFPAGASWCGVEDLAGNVYEWTDDWWDEQRWATVKTVDPRPDPVTQVDGLGVVRGGCFANPRILCRSSTRVGIHADKRDAAVGFRILIDSLPAAASPRSPAP